MAGIRKIVPLSDFRTRIDELLGELDSEADAIIVTRHGRGLFAVQRTELFDQMAEMAQHARSHLIFEQASKSDTPD